MSSQETFEEHAGLLYSRTGCNREIVSMMYWLYQKVRKIIHHRQPSEIVTYTLQPKIDSAVTHRYNNLQIISLIPSLSPSPATR
jgi:hypothetical protein